MNVEQLMKALDDESNESLLNFTTKKIKEMNRNILKTLPLEKEELRDFLIKLKDYRYVDEMTDLKYGTYIRWIPIDIEECGQFYLTRGAVFCEMKITDDGVFCVCKNFGYHSTYFQIAMDKNLLFQKLTTQEKILLSALDHLSK
jgi:hypothetical protein